MAEVKIAFVGAIIEETEKAQQEFNSVVSSYKSIVRCRSGMPFADEGIAVVSIVVMGDDTTELNSCCAFSGSSIVVTGDVDTINAFTGRLGKIKNVQVKSAISKKIISVAN